MVFAIREWSQDHSEFAWYNKPQFTFKFMSDRSVVIFAWCSGLLIPVGSLIWGVFDVQHRGTAVIVCLVSVFFIIIVADRVVRLFNRNAKDNE